MIRVKELWEALQRYHNGVSGHLLRAIKAMYQECRACVRVDGGRSKWLEVKQGVRQGCPMSLWLFNIYLDMVVRKAQASFGRSGVRYRTGAGFAVC